MKKNGFTFMELLVVITIIAVVFAAGVVSYTAISKNSRDARRRADLESMRQALEMCRSIAGEYPSSVYGGTESSSIVCTDTNSTVTMASTPLDPRPCEADVDGTYDYILVSGGGYTLTAACMEDAERENVVTNP